MKHATTLCALIVALTALLLAGCGQKGPLYLPSNEPAQQQTAPATQTQSDQTEQSQPDQVEQTGQSTAPDAAVTE